MCWRFYRVSFWIIQYIIQEFLKYFNILPRYFHEVLQRFNIRLTFTSFVDIGYGIFFILLHCFLEYLLECIQRWVYNKRVSFHLKLDFPLELSQWMYEIGWFDFICLMNGRTLFFNSVLFFKKYTPYNSWYFINY